MKIRDIWSVLLILGFVAACGLGGGASDKCTGNLTVGADKFVGQAKDESQAKLNACNKYCLEKDEEFDARYRIWLDSPRGRAAKKTSKQEAIYQDSDLLDYVTVTCANKCVKNAETEGRMTTQCKE